MATFGNLVEQVYAVLRDSGRQFIRESDVQDWINEAQLDIVARLDLNHGTTTEVTEAIGAGDNTIALPTGFVEVISLRLGDDDDAEFTSGANWNAWSDDGAEPGHTLYRIFGSVIELYPTPDAGTEYTLRFVKEPTTLDSAEDTPGIPTHLHRKLVFYARAMALAQEKDFQGSTYWLGLYEDGLPPVPSGREKYVPGPVQVTPAAGVFDTPGARHI
jgi:hypothetical protein